MASNAPRYDICHFCYIVMGDFFSKKRNPILQADYDYGVNIWMALEYFDGVQNDRLAMQLQELLGVSLRIHTLTCTASKD